MKRQTGTFTAKGDDGRTYTVVVYTNFISAASHDDPHAEIEGMKSLRTSDGHHVNRLGQGSYQIVATGVKLTATSPDAP